MASKKQVRRAFETILVRAGNPPIRLVPETEFRQITGYGLGRFVGRASPTDRIVAVRYNRTLTEIKLTLWHEIAHILFPSRPHWWIECFAAKMTSGHTGRYSRRYAHDPSDLPSKTECIRLAQKASSRLV